MNGQKTRHIVDSESILNGEHTLLMEAGVLAEDVARWPDTSSPSYKCVSTSKLRRRVSIAPSVPQCRRSDLHHGQNRGSKSTGRIATLIILRIWRRRRFDKFGESSLACKKLLSSHAAKMRSRHLRRRETNIKFRTMRVY